MSHINRQVGIGAGVRWSYIPLTAPTGAIAAEAQWQFDNTVNDLVDRAGNGHNLVLTTGTKMHSYCTEGLIGLDFADQECYTVALPANLRITGALSIEILGRQFESTGNEDCYIMCSGVGEAEADNVLWKMSILTGAGNQQRWQYFSEHGGGVNDQIIFAWLAPSGQMSLDTVTRSAAGAVSLYRNGVLTGTGSIAPPTGGGNAIVMIGEADVGAGQQMHGKLYSIRVSKQVLSAAQVLEVYNDCRV